MSILVTGAAGFIGCNIVLSLNESGERDVIAVDDLTKADKCRNLAPCQISDYFDKRDFLARLRSNTAPLPDAIIHMGACSSTTEGDGCYLMENNYRYTLELFKWAQKLRVPFVYASSASVYGAGSRFSEDPANEAPINCYAYSKTLFDRVLRRHLSSLAAPVAGVRFFNVYGPHEQHKGSMASVPFHHFFQFRQDGHARLFEGCHGLADGEQKRDFVHVFDAVKVVRYLLDKEITGIFNCGTGQARSFNDLTLATVNSLTGQGLTLAEAVSRGLIRYIPFPDHLRGKYQSFTQADLGALRATGYDQPFLSVEEGVAQYMSWLSATFPVDA